MSDPSTAFQNGRILCLGVGDDRRGDDGIGQAIVRAVSKEAPAQVTCVVMQGDGADLVAAWDCYDTLVLVDADSMPGPPGIVVHLDALQDELPFGPDDTSSHACSVLAALGLSQVHGTLPASLGLVCINGSHFREGDPISAALVERFDRFVGYVEHRLRLRLAATTDLGNAKSPSHAHVSANSGFDPGDVHRLAMSSAVCSARIAPG